MTTYMPRAISQRYRKLALKLGLRSTRLHSLRHYSATELVAAGVPGLLPAASAMGAVAPPR
jgi:integrase